MRGQVEVKHGRVAMLAALGFVVGEGFHPLFGGGIDVPSYVAFQQTPLQEFWVSVVGIIGVFEFFSLAQIDGGFEIKSELATGEPRIAGDFMFDPLGLKVCALCALPLNRAAISPVCVTFTHTCFRFLTISAEGRRGARGDADQGAQQRPPRDDCHRWHGHPGGRHWQQALLSVTPGNKASASGCRAGCARLEFERGE